MATESVQNSTQNCNGSATSNVVSNYAGQRKFVDYPDLSKSSIMGNKTFLNSSLTHIYGQMAHNPRLMEAHKREIAQKGRNYENINITDDDKKNLIPIAHRLGEYRIMGWRAQKSDEVTETLKMLYEEGNGIAEYMTYCATNGGEQDYKKGLKNPNAPISFQNLKNPLLMAKHFQDLSFGRTPDANEDINLLSDMAIKSKNPALAACLLEATKDSKTTFIGSDKKTAQKLLVDSRNMFDNEKDYYDFISRVDEAYQKLFKGESLDKYVEDHYKPMWKRCAPAVGVAGGVIAGTALAVAGIISAPVSLTALAGAAVFGLGGKAIYSMKWFGKSEEGEKIYSDISKARIKDHKNENPQKYMGFGGLSTRRMTASATY